jgi:uncharacterized DUF497 family protein
VKTFDWNNEKNLKLKEERGISFEEVLYYIESGFVLDDLNNPNSEKYPNQSLLIVDIDNYAYLIPYIEDNDTVFLKTIIPSRKATKKYLGKDSK